MRHYTVRTSVPEYLQGTGYEHLIEVAYILDGNMKYHRLGNEYLIDRALGHWSPEWERRGGHGTPLAKKTIRDYAHWLANSLEFFDRRGIDLYTCTYNQHVKGRYEGELVHGTWSRDGDGLSPVTINAYTEQASCFLSWMAEKRKRDAPFVVPTVSYVKRIGGAKHSRGHRTRTITVRQGKLRVPKRRLRMPRDHELRTWLDDVYRKRGEAGGLICELVLMGALRRAEAVAFRVDTLPLDPTDWHCSNPRAAEADQLILIELMYGTKGPNTEENHGDTIGPPRFINIPRRLALRLHEYRTKVRPLHLQQWVEKVRGAKAQQNRLDESVHLFVNASGKRVGQRISYSQIYRFWREAACPYKGWHPHLGRDWWACSTLMREVALNSQFAELGPRIPSALFLAGALNVIRHTIQPQLGHKNVETCFIYLQWLADELGVALPEQYQAHLDARSEELAEEEYA